MTFMQAGRQTDRQDATILGFTQKAEFREMTHTQIRAAKTGARWPLYGPGRRRDVCRVCVRQCAGADSQEITSSFQSTRLSHSL